MKIAEKMIVASRGRNKKNPSDKTPGSHVEQRLEPNSEWICNTLTSVQKDNYVLEPQLINVGNIYPSAGQNGNIYIAKGLSPTISSGATNNPNNGGIGSSNAPKVLIKQATKEGYIECKLGGVADLSYPESKTRRGRVQDNGDTFPTLTATETGVCRIETPYRIRKLTPRECWRLMDFTDLDFFSAMLLDHNAAVKLMEKYKDDLNGIAIMREAETMQKMSNTQLYKEAGNSIVRAVLVGIFKQMF